ncbi:CDP-alcohol phosphatidyltransferase family protein [Halobaculum marinum]|uniref:CDP-alcohol phosphatidyltransferase family protein n=1 Tax=Halobaculum marinum TaxID=3031996 RepID=A0ABD5X100_9EURY|nr:CDP-alcohol phosphatidyltransferase family protein [Halobaculum sp. DT55]
MSGARSLAKRDTPGTAVVWAGVALVAVAVGAGALTAGVGPGVAGPWLLPTAVVVAWECVFLARRTGLNRAPEADPAASTPRRTGLGVANAVTLFRGLLYAAVAGFLLTGRLPGPWAWAPALLYGAGAALDAVDGAVARGPGRRTVLGEKLDMGVDTLGFLVAPLVGVAWGRIPVWYLALSAARYLFKLGRWRRERRGLPVHDLPESRVRRPLAGLQMAFIAVALAPVLPSFVVAVLAAVVVTPSLVVFVRDYLVVAGHLGGEEDADVPPATTTNDAGPSGGE